MRLEKRVAIVTGGAAGIGRGIVEAFAREGARVAIADRDAKGAREVATQVRSTGGDAAAFEVDVSDSASVARMTNDVVARFGGIDVLVNNAGIRYVKPFLELTEDEWRRTLDVNLTGQFLCCRAAVPHMLKGGGGD